MAEMYYRKFKVHVSYIIYQFAIGIALRAVNS